MLVIPKNINYKLIIGSLVIAITVLGVYSFSKYSKLKNHQEFLELEANLIQNELSFVRAKNESLFVENEIINSQLKQFEPNIGPVLDPVEYSQSDLSLISRYKKQMDVLKLERDITVAKINAVNSEKQSLEEDRKDSAQKLESQKRLVESLKEKNSNLSKLVKKAGALEVKNIGAVALKALSLKNSSPTNKFSDANHIQVCLALLSNELTPVGNKDVYIQIIAPNNVVVSKKGTAYFNDMPLVYSGKTTVNNLRGNIDVCTKMSINEKEKLTAGRYSVKVFQDEILLGKTSLELN